MAQGQSCITERKERGLQTMFEINLEIARRFEYRFEGSKYRYWHFDMNSGCGINEESDPPCKGSPIAFIDAAFSVGVKKFFAGFCDNDPHAIERLSVMRDVALDERCVCYCEDNKNLIDRIPSIIAKSEKQEKAIGSVLCDPNGSDIPFEHLMRLSRACPRIDFIINWNSARFKGDRRHPHFKDRESRPTMEIISELNKRYWWIREPLGKQQFVILIGRNTDISAVKTMNENRFFKLVCADKRQQGYAQSIFNKCTYTKSDLDGLPYPPPSILFNQCSMF